MGEHPAYRNLDTIEVFYAFNREIWGESQTQEKMKIKNPELRMISIELMSYLKSRNNKKLNLIGNFFP